MEDTIVYLIRHAETVDENGIRNTGEDFQAIIREQRQLQNILLMKMACNII